MRLRLVAVAVLAMGVGCWAQEHPAAKISPHWVASWACAQQGPGPSQSQLTDEQLTDTTIRQIVHLSMGGEALRVTFSNVFGTALLRVDAVHVAQAISPASSAIDTSTDHAVTFNGSASAVIPVGAVYVSDAVEMPVKPLSNLAVSFHYAGPPSVQTSHPGSRATSYLLHGVHSSDAELVNAETTVRWLGLAMVDVTADAGAGAVIALGDSITDGNGSTTDGNNRWTDELARRLQADKKLRMFAVVNEGIGGNHLQSNGSGENALERFDRDVLGVSGVQSVIVLEGINDLGAVAGDPNATPEDRAELVAQIEGALKQIILRAHARGILVYGCTIMPDSGSSYHPNAADDAAREAVNVWILTPKHFDGVLDMDKIMRDPANPMHLNPAYDSGDHIHPGPAGYKAMGDAIPLAWFR